MWMWRIPDGTTKTFQSFGHSCATGRVMPDGHQAHRSLVTCLSCHNDNNIVLTGSTDCTAILYNTSSGKMLSQLQCKVLLPDDGMDPNDDSVETVGLSNVLAYAATGTLSGHLQIWDVPTQVCRQQCKHDSGIVKLSWHECQPLVYTCTLEGVVHLWDARTGDEERHWMGHEASILDMQVIKDGSTIVTASDDQTARVFTL
ncbi:hypothetical protein LSH36_735g01024 [Paralvinella palmiformis]|uniref:Uncharacterized protein n=1 Tax=Paralvinella palmiformis TaxID=53620 RepID=A0AAD9MUW4_9ANNE|nr:hypothetical protein LSH36_735g01024 [Paralvinella palmiformis]